MGVRIGLLAGNAQTAVDVTVLAASVGAQVVPSLPEEVRGLRAWSADEELALLVADVAGARGLVAAEPGYPGFPGGDRPGCGIYPAAGGAPGSAGRVGTDLPLVLVHRGDERDPARELAARLGARHLVELPAGAAWLGEQLGARPSVARLAVVGATGGAGATTVAIACAAGADSDCLLVDADPWSAGLDLPLGIPDDDGARWTSIPDAAAPLVADSVRAALPVVDGVTVLTGPLPDPMGARLGAVLEVGRAAFARTVVDLGRDVTALPGSLVDGVVVVCPATLPGVVSTRRLVGALPAQRLLVAVRATGWLPVGEVAEQLGGVPIVEVGRMPRAAELADCADLLSGRTGRTLRRLGQRIWSELA